MAGLELLSNQGIRMDGRRPREIRKICSKLGVSEGADGSASFHQGNTKVLVTVYGPHNITGRKSKSLPDRALINCKYMTASFSQTARKKCFYNDRRNEEIASILQASFASAVQTTSYPGSQIDMYFTVLHADGGIHSACINAGTLALINAGIHMIDFLCGCSAGFANETPIMDVNNLESFLGNTELNLAIHIKTELIILDEMTDRLHLDNMKKVRKVAIEGCKYIYQILDATVREHAKSVFFSR